MGEVAGCVLAATVLDRMTNEVEIFAKIDVEGWHGPVGLRFLRFLGHFEHAVVVVEDDDAGALEFLDRGLMVTHDAGGLLLQGKLHKIAEGEEEEVVGCHDEQVVVEVQGVDGIEQVTDGAETGLIGGGAVIDDGQGFAIAAVALPLLEGRGKLVVGDDDVLGDVGDGVNVTEQAVEDGGLTYLQQRLGRVACQLTEPCGIACCNDNGFHACVVILYSEKGGKDEKNEKKFSEISRFSDGFRNKKSASGTKGFREKRLTL